MTSKKFDLRKKVIANQTTLGWQNSPHVAYIVETDVTHLLDYKKTHATPLSLNTLILKLLIRAIKTEPQVNASIRFNATFSTGEILQNDTIDINMPMLLPNGEMVTTKLTDVGHDSLSTLQQKITRLQTKLEHDAIDLALYDVIVHDSLEKLKKGHLISTLARLISGKFSRNPIRSFTQAEKAARQELPKEKQLSISDLNEGTITISNLGSAVRGTQGYVGLIDIVPTQVCALGLGTIQERPVVLTDDTGEKAIVPRTILPITVVFDHRALDFGDVAPFITTLTTLFADEQCLKTALEE